MGCESVAYSQTQLNMLIFFLENLGELFAILFESLSPSYSGLRHVWLYL